MVLAGFRSLPTDVQRTVLRLACADTATAQQLRQVCRAFAAYAYLTERARTSLDISTPEGARNLPYLPHLRSIECPSHLLGDTAHTRYADSILSTHLAAWSALTSLEFRGDRPPHFVNCLHLAPQLSQLTFFGVPAASEGACALHDVWQLTQLRALSINFTAPLPGAPPAFQQLSQLQLLTRLQYEAPFFGAEGAFGELALANAVGSVPALQALILGRWPCTQELSEPATWQALMQSVSKLTRLTLLKFENWDLDPISSAVYMPALACTLRTLRALSHLELHGDTDWEMGSVDSAGTDTGSALVAAIGTLHLHTLVLCNLEAVDARNCCRHLAPLVDLQHLTLTNLPPWEPYDGAPEVAGESSFVHLLSSMTRLQTLALEQVGVGGRDALRMFCVVIPTLADLRLLDVQCNQLGAAPLMALAHSCRQLPKLRVLCESSEIEDLNWVAGDGVFRDGSVCV